VARNRPVAAIVWPNGSGGCRSEITWRRSWSLTRTKALKVWILTHFGIIARHESVLVCISPSDVIFDHEFVFGIILVICGFPILSCC